MNILETQEKKWKNDGYVIRLARADEAPLIYKMLLDIYNAMPLKSYFALSDEDLDWVQEHITTKGFATLAEDRQGDPAGFLITIFPGEGDDSLGYDVGLSGNKLYQNAQLEMAMVAPEHRGHHLEYRLIEDTLERLAPSYRYITASADPENLASVKSIERAGLKAVVTKAKYGGLTRHIFLLDREAQTSAN